MTNRLFIALKFPEEIIDKIIQYRNEAARINNNLDFIKWEKRDKIHLTLKFIGDVEEELNDKIIAALSFIQNENPFELELIKFGFFYKDKKPKILWIGINANDHLNNLVNQIETELASLGIQKEKRKFKPHVTLLRIKNKVDENFINSFENFKLPSLKFYANEISLIKSELLPNASKYAEIKNLPVGRLDIN